MGIKGRRKKERLKAETDKAASRANGAVSTEKAALGAAKGSSCDAASAEAAAAAAAAGDDAPARFPFETEDLDHCESPLTAYVGDGAEMTLKCVSAPSARLTCACAVAA